MIKKNKAIFDYNLDFAKWYTDICKKTELMEYSSVKGFIIYLPYSYAIWEKIKEYLDEEFKKNNHENIYMPLVIPEKLFQKEKEHITGFAPETLVVTIGGGKKIHDKLIIRPTSEALFTDFYSRTITTYRDLPKLYNQWCSVARWEKNTRPFLRGNEFLWQEGHTMHETKEEALKETLNILDIYIKMGKKLLAIPFISGKKSEKEKFAGAEITFTIETLTYDNKSLQCGTSHYFAQKFSKVFNVKFLDKNNKLQFPYQTSWGISTRLIGAIITVHSDQNGLILPPYIAPIQVIIIPIQENNNEVIKKANFFKEKLIKKKIRVKIDFSNHTPGWKFAKWEMKGIPIRLEIGVRDIKNNKFFIIKRNNNEKISFKENEIIINISKILKKIHNEMYKKALINLKKRILNVNNFIEFKKNINNGYLKAFWCGNKECEDKIKEITSTTIRCIPLNNKINNKNAKCIFCQKKAIMKVFFSKSY